MNNLNDGFVVIPVFLVCVLLLWIISQLDIQSVESQFSLLQYSNYVSPTLPEDIQFVMLEDPN